MTNIRTHHPLRPINSQKEDIPVDELVRLKIRAASEIYESELSRSHYRKVKTERIVSRLIAELAKAELLSSTQILDILEHE